MPEYPYHRQDLRAHVDNEISMMESLPESRHFVKYYGTFVGAIPETTLAMLNPGLVDTLRMDQYGNRYIRVLYRVAVSWVWACLRCVGKYDDLLPSCTGCMPTGGGVLGMPWWSAEHAFGIGECL